MKELEESIKTMQADHKLDVQRLEHDAGGRSQVYVHCDVCQQKHDSITKELGRGNKIFDEVLSEIKMVSSLTIRNDERFNSITKQMDIMASNTNTLLNRAFDKAEAKG